MRSLGVGIVGFGWMGRVHAQAYSRVLHHFPDLGVAPLLVAVADEVPGRAEEAAGRFGFETATGTWRELLADPRVEAVSVTAPNWLHREIGVAVVEAGRHLWIEKPVGLSAADARAVADAVAAAGVHSAVGFNYRNVPAVQLARELIGQGGIGRITHGRVQFLSDYAASPDGALTWRYSRELGGSGVLGDLASHAVDLVRHVLGEVVSLVSDTSVFIPERPRAGDATAGHVSATGGEPGPVENEDQVGALLRLASGARVLLEASRVAAGEQNAYGFEVHGTEGRVAWDFRRMGELEVSRGPQAADLPVQRVLVGPGAGDFAAFQPGAGIAMGYDDTKVVEAHNFLRSISEARPYGADVLDAARAAEVVEALVRSATTHRWVDLPGF